MVVVLFVLLGGDFGYFFFFVPSVILSALS